MIGACPSSLPAWQSFLGFGSSAEIVIDLTEAEKRKKVDVKNEDGKKEKLPLYLDGENVTGKVSPFAFFPSLLLLLLLLLLLSDFSLSLFSLLLVSIQWPNLFTQGDKF